MMQKRHQQEDAAACALLERYIVNALTFTCAHTVRLHQGMDNKEQEHRDWWAALLTVCEAELTEAIRQDEIDRARHRGEPPPPSAMRPREAGVHVSVEQDIHAFLAGKRRCSLRCRHKNVAP